MMLGEMLIAEGALDADGLQEALDWQVLYGGRLGTNLLELHLIEEETLAKALGKQQGCEVAFGELQTDPDVAGLVPNHVANRREIVPWKLEKRRLKVLCMVPEVEVFDDLAAKLDRVCVPVIAPEWRIIQLLRREYAAKRQMRALDFGVVPEEQLAERRRKRKRVEEGAGSEALPELIDESAFNDIYNQVMAGRDANQARPRPGAVVSRELSAPPPHEAPADPTSASWPPPAPPMIATPSFYAPSSVRAQPPPISQPPPIPKPPPLPAPQPPPIPHAHAGQPARPPATTTKRSTSDPNLGQPAMPLARVPISRPTLHAHRGHPAHPPAIPKALENPFIATPVEVKAVPAALSDLETTSESAIQLEELDPSALTPLDIAPAAQTESPDQTAVDLKPVAPFELAHPEPDGHPDGEETVESRPLPSIPSAPAWDMHPPEAEPVDTSPLDFKHALEMLSGVTDRDAIAHIVLRCARGHAARALLMTVQGGVALGWDGLGEGLEGGAAQAVAVPLAGESVFQFVVKMRSHYMGPLRKTAANVRFLAQCGKKVPLSAVVLPILFRGRVSHLLYLDNGHKQQAPTDVGEMLILAQKVTATVDALVAKKQRSQA